MLNILDDFYFEDLYSGDFEQRKEFLSNICKFIEVSPSLFDSKTDELRYLLMKGSQKSNAIYDLIPNREEIENTFSAKVS